MRFDPANYRFYYDDEEIDVVEILDADFSEVDDRLNRMLVIALAEGTLQRMDLMIHRLKIFKRARK